MSDLPSFRLDNEYVKEEVRVSDRLYVYQCAMCYDSWEGTKTEEVRLWCVLPLCGVSKVRRWSAY